jgi:aryl-alcohol dehydrogenase-like predicted oxidoreductase
VAPGDLDRGPGHGKVIAVVEPTAVRHGVRPRQIALAWHLHRPPVTLPIPGATSIAHLRDNLATGDIELSAEDIAAIADSAPEA